MVDAIKVDAILAFRTGFPFNLDHPLYIANWALFFVSSVPKLQGHVSSHGIVHEIGKVNDRCFHYSTAKKKEVNTRRNRPPRVLSVV